MRNINEDCLIYTDLHSINTDGTSDNDNCRDWCDSNDNCADFTVYANRCYVKNFSCGNDIIENTNAILYIKQGEFK